MNGLRKLATIFTLLIATLGILLPARAFADECLPPPPPPPSGGGGNVGG